ncbi:hypothetical protein MLD38_004094 [Melastoma candidum]|uniref:Uncharacterized protein n=1 Tax=Melastoma candidum TaxID=119954 RepID=A0ACB9S8G6_9MYRT|nr:hypothetical protein MLD38_004094 [Melastoma candidum]
MSARWRKKHPKLELKLHLSSPRARRSGDEVARSQPLVENPLTDPPSSPSSCDSSCLSSTAEDDNPQGDRAQVEPRCPRCKSTVLLDLLGVDLNSQKNKKMKTT